MAQPGDEVIVVICIADRDDGDVFHVFSSMEAANKFCETDDRAHVISNRILDFPEHHEGKMN